MIYSRWSLTLPLPRSSVHIDVGTMQRALTLNNVCIKSQQRLVPRQRTQRIVQCAAAKKDYSSFLGKEHEDDTVVFHFGTKEEASALKKKEEDDLAAAAKAAEAKADAAKAAAQKAEISSKEN
mmetsp:Transcript_17685/g.34253  ORF Transcript_17685/g.34253 Transcript_17685/m.34253 type:complete len:123 (+) Transcript_17685:2-370(+)